jgi:hypothetical protein
MGSFEEEGELPARARARAAVRSLHVHVPTARAWRLQVGQGADPGIRHLQRVQAPAAILTPATSRPWPLSRNSILELPADKPVVNGAENSSLWATGAVSRRRRGGWRSSRQPGWPSPVKRFGKAAPGSKLPSKAPNMRWPTPRSDVAFPPKRDTSVPRHEQCEPMLAAVGVSFRLFLTTVANYKAEGRRTGRAQSYGVRQ